MDFDINLVLVPITLVFLVVFLVDKFALKQHHAVVAHEKAVKNAEKNADEVAIATLKGNPPSENFLVRWAYEFLPVLLVIVLVRSFVVEPFNIPSSSMVPTLHTGDFVLVDKTAYGLRLPLTHTKILDTGAPEHGDVAVFRVPTDNKTYFIKRIIGLPGDTVSFADGKLSINGEVVATNPSKYDMTPEFASQLLPQVIDGEKISDADRAEYGKMEESHAFYMTENLGKHSYQTRYLTGATTMSRAEFIQKNSAAAAESQGATWAITVPQGQYFVMGDNRDRSDDGRFWGFVPEANLAGKATYIWMHKESGFKLPSFDRVGKID